MAPHNAPHPDDPYRDCETYLEHGACVCSTGYPSSCTAKDIAPRTLAQRHEVYLTASGRGCYAHCSCEWSSEGFGGVAGAQYAWACHVRDEAQKEVRRALEAL